jgi:hypothetical protein
MSLRIDLIPRVIGKTETRRSEYCVFLSGLIYTNWEENISSFPLSLRYAGKERIGGKENRAD